MPVNTATLKTFAPAMRRQLSLLLDLLLLSPDQRSDGGWGRQPVCF
jgi:hypothetical protein